MPRITVHLIKVWLSKPVSREKYYFRNRTKGAVDSHKTDTLIIGQPRKNEVFETINYEILFERTM
jgi:hypothetical protein